MKKISFTALKYRDFRLLWIGLFISRIGSEMQVVAVIWHLYLLTNSPLAIGYIGLARFIPLLPASFIAGVVADKYDRRTIMLVSQILLTFVTMVFVYLVSVNQITPMVIYILIAVNSLVASFDTPARQALIPKLVERKDLLNAISLMTLLWQTSKVIGPALAGLLIASSGLNSIYIINALTFIAVIVGLLMMSQKKFSANEVVLFNIKTIKEGFSFIYRNSLISSTMLLDFIATFFASAITMMPFFAKEILAVGAQGLGLLYAAPSLGAVIAGIVLSSFKTIKQQGRLLLVSVFIYGLATVCFAITRSFLLACIFLIISGIGDMISSVIRNTLRQIITPDHLRGRTSSVNMIFIMGGPQLGEVEAGWLANLIGVAPSVAVGGVATMLSVAIVGWLTPKLRRYQGD